MEKRTLKIFVVEDDAWYGQILLHHLGLNPDFQIELFTRGADLLKNIYRKPDIICMDYNLSDYNGDELLTKIFSIDKLMPIVVISGQQEISVAVELLKKGARDYIIKDEFTNNNLWKSIIQIRENLILRDEVEELRAQLGEKFSFENTIIGQSEAIKKTFYLLDKAVKTNINISLVGETGTGKEVYARAIHFNSDRKKKPFIAVNMGAIPKELIESELFGYEKGAFTGAIGLKTGKFEDAQGGTLFLDEIGELELSLQSKLLRVIQERELTRIGGTKNIKIDIRLITATHKNMVEEVKAGRFREDLFFRIIGLPIELPALRNRGNDIIILAKHFIFEFAKFNKIKAFTLSDSAKTKLRKYTWPGNIRELKAVIDLACVMSENNVIDDQDLSFYDIGDTLPYDKSEKKLKEYEIEIIAYFLKKYNENVLLVADKLEVGKSKIYNLIKSGEIKMS